MSLIGRISNKIRAYTPTTKQDLFAHQRISLHKVDPQLLGEHDDAMRALGSDRVILPPEDTIAYSHKNHRGTVLPQRQADYNQALRLVKTNAQELKTLEGQRIKTIRRLESNPYKHQTDVTNRKSIEHAIAAKIAEKEHVAQALLVQHRAYYNALNSRSIPQPTQPLMQGQQAAPLALHLPEASHVQPERPEITEISMSQLTPEASMARSEKAEGQNSAFSSKVSKLGSEISEASNSQLSPEGSGTDSETIYQTIIGVKGMTCGGCEASLSKALRVLPEVTAVQVSHIEGRAVVTHGPETDIDLFKNAIQSCGKAHTSIQEKMFKKPRENRSVRLPKQEETALADDPAPAESFDMSGVAASCCGGPALGDLGKAADASNNAATHKYALGGALPSTPLELGFAAATGYLGAGGALASLKTFRSYHTHARRIEKALGELSDIRSILGVQSADLLVLERFLKQQLQDVRFIQYVPGAASGLGSSLIGVGSLLAKFSPPGLMISSLDASMHVVKSTRLRKRYANALHRMPDIAPSEPPVTAESLTLMQQQAYQAQRELLQQEMRTCALRIAGGAQTALGTAALVPVSLAVYGASVKAAGVPLIVAGVSCLVPGIGLSLRFNPYLDLGIRSEFAKPLTAYRNHLDSLRQKKQALDVPAELENVARLFGQEKVLEHRLQLAKNRKTLSSRYKELYREGLSRGERLGNMLRTQSIDAGSMAVFQLPEQSIGRLKRWNKERLADCGAISSQKRLAALDCYSHLHNTWDGIRAETHLKGEGMSAEQGQFNALFLALERDAAMRSGVMKLVAMQALDSRGTLHQDYAEIFQATPEQSAAIVRADIPLELAKIRSTSACCLADSSTLFQLMKERFFRPTDQPQPALSAPAALQRDQLYQRLAHRCDQYILFGIPRESASDRRVYARYLAQYHKLQSEQNQERLLTGC